MIARGSLQEGGSQGPAPGHATEGSHILWRFRSRDIPIPSEPQEMTPSPHPEHGGGRLQRTSFYFQTCRGAAPSQQMEPPSTPRPLANVNARARGIPGAAEASPSWALSVRALQPEGSRAEGGLPGLEDGQAAALAAT